MDEHDTATDRPTTNVGTPAASPPAASPMTANPSAVNPAVVDRPAATAPADSPPAASPAKPGFRERGGLRRRLRFLRRARELAYRDLGGLVFEMHRLGQRRDDLVAAKLGTLERIDGELRAAEAALGERRGVTVLREAGVTACARCAAIHSSEDRFCPSCGFSMGRHDERPIAGAAPTPTPTAAPYATPQAALPAAPAVAPPLASPATSVPAAPAITATPPRVATPPPAAATAPSPAAPAVPAPAAPVPAHRSVAPVDEPTEIVEPPTRIVRPAADDPAAKRSNRA